MKERPILFNAEMVQAILSGRKTQTRRVMKDQPTDCFSPMNMGLELDYTARWYTPGIVDKHGYLQPAKKEIFGVADEHEGYECPIGAVGDQLWVRETFSKLDEFEFFDPAVPELVPDYWYWADGNPTWGNWTRPKPSIHMPRAASRINLLITGVRVERLDDISQHDARCEGIVDHHNVGQEKYLFFRLWRDIYGEESWSDNPWVWVIEFERIGGDL